MLLHVKCWFQPPRSDTVVCPDIMSKWHEWIIIRAALLPLGGTVNLTSFFAGEEMNGLPWKWVGRDSSDKM